MTSKTTIAAALFLSALLIPHNADAKQSGFHSHAGSHSTTHRGGSQARATDAPRDSHGRIKRSSSAKTEFKKSRPCPATGKSSGACPGYVIDHVKPLKRGGADHPSNMQWQTKEAAKEKDRTE